MEARVLDCDRRLGREKLRQLFVLLGEVVTVALFRQVQVSVRDAAQQNRYSEKRSHRRVTRGEANRARIIGDVVESERLSLADDDAEEAPPDRFVTDRDSHFVTHSRGHEPLERAPGRVDDAERRIPSAGELGGGLDDSLQQRLERELCGE